MLNLNEGEYFGQALKIFEDSMFKLSITAYEEQSNIEEHYHENDYLSILINGSYIEKGEKREQMIIAGDALFRPKKYVHKNQFLHTSGTCFNIEFKPSWDEAFEMKFHLPRELVQFKTAYFPSLFKLLLNFKRSDKESILIEYIYDWLFHLWEHKNFDSTTLWLQKVVDILDHEVDTFHSLNDLAQRIFIHPVYLSRAFKEKTGITVSNYQLKAKLRNAVLLLLNTSQSISCISFENGFYDDAHFIRSFKAVYGLSPYQFRRQVTGKRKG